jgi:protein-S-isoprenylcysteine O-methyltransferase Ste14
MSLASRPWSEHHACVGSPFDRIVRSFFILLALAVVGLPVLALAASASNSVRWGTVPEWIGAFGLLLIAHGVWKLARSAERTRRGSDVRTRSDA